MFLTSVALVQDIRLKRLLRSRQFDLEPLILRRTANNSFLDFQQIFSFTPLLIENPYSFSHQTIQN